MNAKKVIKEDISKPLSAAINSPIIRDVTPYAIQLNKPLGILRISVERPFMYNKKEMTTMIIPP